MDSTAQLRAEKEILQLSADKYRWYTEKRTDLMKNSYDDSLVFVHLNGHISNKKNGLIKCVPAVISQKTLATLITKIIDFP